MDALRQYLKRSGETGHAFALRIGRVPSTISRLLNGERLPSIDLALDVEKGTGGEVTAKQFMETMIEEKRESLLDETKKRGLKKRKLRAGFR